MKFTVVIEFMFSIWTFSLKCFFLIFVVCKLAQNVVKCWKAVPYKSSHKQLGLKMVSTVEILIFQKSQNYQMNLGCVGMWKLQWLSIDLRRRRYSLQFCHNFGWIVAEGAMPHWGWYTSEGVWVLEITVLRCHITLTRNFGLCCFWHFVILSMLDIYWNCRPDMHCLQKNMPVNSRKQYCVCFSICIELQYSKKDLLYYQCNYYLF